MLEGNAWNPGLQHRGTCARSTKLASRTKATETTSSCSGQGKHNRMAPFKQCYSSRSRHATALPLRP